MTVDETSNGRTLLVAAGETVEVCLGEIRTAGYHWSVEDSGNPQLELEAERFYAPRYLRMGKHIWRFRATEPGLSHIRLCYRHEWNGETPLQTYEVGLTVVEESRVDSE